MSRTKTPTWRRLDNAAKIFPPTSNKHDTKVFRFACTLKEEIVPEILQNALDKTMEAFPLYASIIRKGLFWYYFETSSIKPTVKEECKSPCSTLYNENSKSLLFEVSYYKKRINLEIYHALTDGVGALQFLRTLVFHYLLMQHEELKEAKLSLDYDASHAEKEMDGFKKYFSPGKSAKNPSLGKAYRIKGERLEGDVLKVINGVASVKAILQEAHQYETTLTVYLGAILIMSIYKEMARKDRKHPVVVSVPVNLRPYFKSSSARNFFSVVHVPYYFKEKEPEFEEVISYLKEFFEKELTTEKFQLRLNRLVALEHNYFTRAIPLILKKPTLWFAHHLTNNEVTTSFSNIGKITMPKELEPYIDVFDVYTSTTKVQVCLCSYGDKLSISFTSPFVNSEVQKHFFRTLTSRGIKVEISTNIITE
ncbi:hypothetical protein CS063_01745 [Sporanaerobium hydrogeniformans]|uniref:Uncharacterized protein n=1 Tax=Sporanaerobium hydrogeniformans TaxID=3072179 RepID=A0AC61DG15_9FIRM|nr:hypothetical protein [Sporanaerobium hydrogeniformans]PHV72224.1 hypothetical protein CS063_01745 [Sporanaerobium hydrogeniformans]